MGARVTQPVQRWEGPYRRGSARHLTQGTPPPDTALSAVGGGALTPAPEACTAVAVAGAAADRDDCGVGLPVGSVKSVPITTRILPAGSVPSAWVGRAPSVPARRDALAAAPAPYSTTET